jgi:hypothetical protein
MNADWWVFISWSDGYNLRSPGFATGPNPSSGMSYRSFGPSCWQLTMYEPSQLVPRTNSATNSSRTVISTVGNRSAS